MFRSLKILVLFYVLVFLSLFPVSAGCAESLPRGIFVMALDEPCALSSRQEIIKLVNLAKRTRAKIIFIQIYRGNKAWFPSLIADSSPYKDCLKNIPEDPLKLLIKQAHSFGIEVHVWLNMLSLSKNKNAPLLQKYGFSVLTSNLKEKYSLEDYKIDNQYFLEPGDMRVRRELSGIIEEVIRSYPGLDGILFDYVRYPDKNPAYGYTEMNMGRFKRASGVKTIKEEDEIWKDWKRAQVTETLQEFIDTARRINPNIQVSATGCMPIQRAYYEAFQDWTFWLNRGLVDFVIAMDYSPDHLEFERWISAIKAKVSDFRKVKIAVGAYKLGSFPGEFKEELRFSENAGAGGCVIFHYSSLLDNPVLANILEEDSEF